MQSIKDSIKNGILANSNRLSTGSNAPKGSTANKSIWKNATATAYEEFGKYASNVFDAEIQGLDKEDFFKWTKVKLRSSIISDATTGDQLISNWNKILILDKNIDYVPAGAYVRYNNAVWIVFNTDIVASEIATAIVQRCNAVFNSIDYYGNVIKTPMVYTKGMTLSAEPFYHQYNIMPDGYEHAIFQRNEHTKDMRDNTRIILGKSAFVMNGVVDFALEYTDDETTNRTIRVDLRATEVTGNDDMERRIADANDFSFVINTNESETVIIGQSESLEVEAIRYGKIIESTEEYPISYLWESSDETIATVTDDGVVEAIAEGVCTITVTLEQNKEIKSTIQIYSKESLGVNYVDFITPVPYSVDSYDSFTVSARYYENGIETEEPLMFEIKNATYTATSNTVTVNAMQTGKDITLKAYYGEYSITKIIKVVGF